MNLAHIPVPSDLFFSNEGPLHRHLLYLPLLSWRDFASLGYSDFYCLLISALSILIPLLFIYTVHTAVYG